MSKSITMYAVATRMDEGGWFPWCETFAHSKRGAKM